MPDPSVSARPMLTKNDANLPVQAVTQLQMPANALFTGIKRAGDGAPGSGGAFPAPTEPKARHEPLGSRSRLLTQTVPQDFLRDCLSKAGDGNRRAHPSAKNLRAQ